MATYSVVMVARNTQREGPATLVEMGPVLDPSDLEWTNKLNREQELSFTCDPTKLQSDIRERLRDLVATPMEVWVYRDAEMVFAGPIVGYSASDGLLDIDARGLFYYARYLDLGEVAFTGTYSHDKYQIARQLFQRFVDYFYFYTLWHSIDFDWDWQGWAWKPGRDLAGSEMTYTPKPGEPHVVYDELIELAAQGGFDFDIAPDTRHLDFYSPKRGTDLSDTVFMDARSIDEYEVFVGVGPDDFSSRTYVVGETETASNERPWATASWGLVIRTVTVDHDDGLPNIAINEQNGRDKQLVRPGGSFLPVEGVKPTDFDVGDTVTFSYDFGLGLVTFTPRIISKKVSVDDLGQESISVEFE